jgi:hypothetical protein
MPAPLDRVVGTTHDASEMHSKPWHPTQAQEEAALALSDSTVGARVRSHSDGTVEVRTVESGAFRRYLVEKDGTAALVEAHPPTWRHAWSIRLCWIGLMLAFVAVLPAIFVDDFPAALMVVAGVVIFVVAMGLMPYGKPPPGERWVRIGGAEE